jgi:hypothetical protein
VPRPRVGKERATGVWQLLKALLWIVVIIFIIGLLVVFGILDLIF